MDLELTITTIMHFPYQSAWTKATRHHRLGLPVLLAFVIIFAGSILLGLLPQTAYAKSPTVDGHAEVPGSGGREVDYEIVAKANPKTGKVDMHIRVKDRAGGGGAYSFVFCAMIQTTLPKISMPNYDVELKGGKWTCKRNGNVNRPPSFHFGCHTITVPANGAWSPVMVLMSGPIPGETIDDSKLLSVYWDLLESAPFDSSCDAVKQSGVNFNIHPCLTCSSTNLWAGLSALCGGCTGETFSMRTTPFPLCAGDGGAEHCRTLRWEVGNWFTMNFPGSYPAHLVGEITGAPPGTAFVLAFPDQFEVVLQANEVGFAAVDESFTITGPDTNGDLPVDELMYLLIAPGRPLDEGTVVRFSGDILALEGNTGYEPGAKMYAVAMVFMTDTQAPIIDAVTVTESDGRPGYIDVEVLASDATTMPAVASILLIHEDAQQLTAPLMASAEMVLNGEGRFTGQAGPLPRGSSIDYVVTVEDLQGNSAVSGVGSITLSEPKNLWLLIGLPAALIAIVLVLAGAFWKIRSRAQS